MQSTRLTALLPAALISLAFVPHALAERNDHRPVFSPDGSRIVFMSNSNRTGGDWELFLMDADGRNLKRLTNRKGWDGYAVWSPDGKRIVYDRGDEGKKSPWFLDLETGESSRLGDFDGWLSISDWSRDGETLLGFQETGGQRDLVLVNLDGSIKKRLTNTPTRSEHDAHFSPNGTLIAYANGPVDGSESSLELFHVKTEEGAILHISKGRIYGLSWSPAGTLLAFTDTPRGGDEESDVFLVASTSRLITRMTSDPALDHMAVWRPDGRSLLFTSYRTGEERIYSLDPKSKSVARIWAGDGE